MLYFWYKNFFSQIICDFVEIFCFKICKIRLFDIVHCFTFTYSNFFLEIEDAKKATENAALQSSPPVSGTTTPDYAAGLTAPPTYAPATPQPTVPSTPGKYFFQTLNLNVYFLLI